MSFVRLIAPAAVSLALVVGAAHAGAAPSSNRAVAVMEPSVEGFVLERVPSLAPGVRLNFSVFGTEGAVVSLYVEGVPRLIEMREVQPGVYEGSHVVASRDALQPTTRVIATMERGGHVARATLADPLVVAPVALPWAEARAKVQAPAAAVEPAVAARATQSAPVPTYAAAASVPTYAAEARPTYAAEARPTAVPGPCRNCATVEAVRTVDMPVTGGVAGAVTRAVEDHRRRMLGLLDAVGVSAAGRERQRLADKITEYEVVLRLPDGRSLTRRYPSRPAFLPGDTVPLTEDGGRDAAASE